MPSKKPTDKVTPITSNVQMARMLHALSSEIVSRAALQGRLGKSYWSTDGTGAKRDLYKALGYVLDPKFDDYYSRYKRQDIAAAIVDAPVAASWRKLPIVTESGDEETQFEKVWKTIVKKRKVWHYLSRVDKISGIGQYGLLLLGVNDGKPLSEPLDKATDLIFLRPYYQDACQVKQWQEDQKQERFGLPLIYGINVATRTDSVSSIGVDVHYSRVIHVAEGCVEDDIYGTPRLEKVLNRLQDLELVSGGSAEMFWRGAFPGLGFSLKQDAQGGVMQDLDAIEDEIQNYLHDLQRYLRLTNVDVKELAPQVADPSNHVDILVTLVAAGARIPKRILLGSERGELASSQDEKNWLDRIEERRINYCETDLIRPLIDRLVEVGVLPEPKEEYAVEWPDLLVKSDKERMELAKLASEALSKYVTSPGADMIVPPTMFLQKHLGYTDDEIAEIESILGPLDEQGEEFQPQPQGGTI